MSRRAKVRVSLLFALLGAVALFWVTLTLDRDVRGPAVEGSPVATSMSLDGGARRGGLRPRNPWLLQHKPLEGGPCLPGADVICLEGDVWQIDSCGEPEEKLDECETRFCRDDECEEAPLEPCKEPSEGRCDGDVVRSCVAGRDVAVDCEKQGLRCLMGDEGAECAPLVPPAERCRPAPAQCDGDTLVRCEQGRSQRLDCRSLRSKCLQLPGKKEPACVTLRAPELIVGSCGACGCPVVASASNEASCDGRDDDGNGLVDELLSCGEVPVVAFVVTGNGGQTSHAREDIDTEIANANRAFAGDLPEQGIVFRLADVVYVADEALLDLDSSEFTRLADDARVHPVRSEFYVPLLFTEMLSAGGRTPRIGVSTLPNGTCGGVQEGRGPDVGLVAVAKGRSPTTVVHELGHFLGLCHTHDQQTAPLPAARDASGLLIACDTGSCRGDGDGICDTPFDPGPEQCTFDALCQPVCRSAALPDAANLMSYYTPCRQRFSPQQLLLMQHTLALRRGWHACLDKGCSCNLGGDECPMGMSCLPVTRGGERTTQCLLAGPLPPGADCQDTAQCGGAAVCFSDARRGVQRCVRACRASSAGCDCVQAREGLSVCSQDLTR